jgi:hypothetical protein
VITHQPVECNEVAMGWVLQVLGGKVEGDKVQLEVEPAKGGDKEVLEADVVLVSAGGQPANRDNHNRMQQKMPRRCQQEQSCT